LPDNIIQDLNLQTLDSLVSQISNLSESFIISRNLTIIGLVFYRLIKLEIYKIYLNEHQFTINFTTYLKNDFNINRFP
jgi:hypothetical protein